METRSSFHAILFYMKLVVDLTKTAEYRYFNDPFFNISSDIFNKMSENAWSAFLDTFC